MLQGVSSALQMFSRGFRGVLVDFSDVPGTSGVFQGVSGAVQGLQRGFIGVTEVFMEFQGCSTS